MTQPSVYEQYMLQLINAERAKVGSQPLAFNGVLNEAAEDHSQWMVAAGILSHTGEGGSSPPQRMNDAGYSFAGSYNWGENVAWGSALPPSGYQDDVARLHGGLMNSYYHRINIVNDGFREIGIGIEVGGRVAITQDFARSGTGSFLTGVAFDDNDGDRFYDPGEGIGSLSISITGSSGTYTTTTMASGGYQYKLAAGTYTVTFSGEGIATTKHQVTVGTKNVKLDLIDPATGENQPVPSDPGPVFGNLIEGTPGVDALYGSSAADTINGREGNDALHGKGGNDFLYGGTGDDKISGGKGTDQLIGGDGADMFVFAGGSGTDTITDFEGGADKIRLNLTSLGLASTADAQSHASRVGDDLVYNFDSGDVIVLQDYYIF